jgi:hypothetical protein
MRIGVAPLVMALTWLAAARPAAQQPFRSGVDLVAAPARSQSAPPAPAVPVVDAALVPILTAAASYVDHFTTVFGNVIAEERYVQDLLSGGGLMVRQSAASRQVRHRELRSDLVLVRTSDVLGWQMFRDVFEADGALVRDRQERLAQLFQQPAAGALDQAARIAQESARFNIGAVERTLNTPVLTLLFLQATQQPRFQFSRGVRTPGFSDRVDVIDFAELARPTIIRTVTNDDRPASGRLWIDRDTGAILQTELVLAGDGVSIRFTTLFRPDGNLNVAVPTRMQEEYLLPSGKLIGTATYSSFRQFSVSTDTNVAAPGRAPE